MKRFENSARSIFIACAFTLIASPALAAGGMNLSWNDCGVFGDAQRSFDCASNAGSNDLYVSAVMPVPISELLGMSTVIDFQTNAATLSPWWQVQDRTAAVGCRSGQVTGSFNFAAGPFSCVDPWGGTADGGINCQYQFGQPNRGRFRAVCMISTPTATDATTEYYMCRFAISNAKTVGDGSCGGCTDGVCIVLNEVFVWGFYPDAKGYTITNPLTRQYITWQNGGFTEGAGPYGGSGCPGATPARSTTWGSVKALYR